MAIRTIRTEDFFGEPADFEIIWETVCMTCTFAVGIQTDKRNEFSIFHVTNMGGKDIYTVLDTGFLDVYQKYGFKWGESHVHMESNTAVQQQWQYYENEQHKRRRCYKKAL